MSNATKGFLIEFILVAVIVACGKRTATLGARFLLVVFLLSHFLFFFSQSLYISCCHFRFAAALNWPPLLPICYFCCFPFSFIVFIYFGYPRYFSFFAGFYFFCHDIVRAWGEGDTEHSMLRRSFICKRRNKSAKLTISYRSCFSRTWVIEQASKKATMATKTGYK